MTDKPEVWIEDESQEEGSYVALPCSRSVCGRCKGEGELALPGVVFTADDMAELGEDFLDDYLNGHYNSACPECQGMRVVWTVDEDKCSPELLKAWQEQEREVAESYAIQEAERMAGA